MRTPRSTVIQIGKRVLTTPSTDTKKDVPNGPYVVRLDNGDTFPVSRFFEDTYEAFIGGAVKSVGASFEWIGIQVSLYHLSPALIMRSEVELHSRTL